MAPTIRANIFHIRHYILIHTKKTISLKDFNYLKVILKGIGNLDPIPEGTVPLNVKIIKQAINIINSTGKKSWFMYVIQVMIIFAWAFCLRCSEYNKTKRWKAPTVSEIKKTKKDGVDILLYKLDRRKTNVHGPSQHIAIPCTCVDFDLCGFHTMMKFGKRCKQKGCNTHYLFPYIHNGKWKPVSDITFRRELGKILKKIYKNKYNPKIHRAHGLRYGGITDLGSIGIPFEWIRRITGHAKDSNVLLQYLKLSPKSIAKLIRNYADKNSKWDLKL